ncbi:MAG TPA: amidohydrolase family protein [Vicinamibacterales bacterium]|nr:amidohydrolase family protein [Vicinamibacterales bacterium]
MRAMMIAAAVLCAVQLAAAQGGRSDAIEIQPGQQCPPGTTEVRPRRCLAPELPPPSILDYRPRSTLVTAKHEVPRAKFPVVDFHGHPRGFESPEGLASLGATMDRLNIRVMVAANSMSGESLKRAVAAIAASPAMKDRVRVMAGVDFRDVGAGWAGRAVAQLEADAAAGAVAIGEISKGLGLSIRKSDGTRLRIDDPALDPIWKAAGRLGLPVFIHTADPQEFFVETLDYTNERWLELTLFPNRRYPPSKYPSFEQLAKERDNLFRRHPDTIFVMAHMGWHANDLGRLGRMLDEMPNLYTEIGAVLYDIGRQPRTAHDFFVKYQDRILFGKDSFQPEEYPYYWRVLETADEYFDYYRAYHAFWKLYGIDLPDEVLRKVYYGNALRIMKGMPREGWPSSDSSAHRR